MSDTSKKVIIVFIVLLTLTLLCLGIFIALTPVEVPVQPLPPDPHPANELTNVEALEIALPNTRIPKRMVIKNYTDGLIPEQINALTNSGYKVSYRVLNKDSKNYMLVVPYRNNGTLSLTQLKWDTFEEEYLPDNERIFFTDEIGENYALLLQYDRPEQAQYELKLTQQDCTVTYRIQAPAQGKKLSPIEHLVADEKTEDEIYYQEPEGVEQTTAPVAVENDIDE